MTFASTILALSRFGFAARTIPTTDLYFLNACHRLLDRPPFRRGPLCREGANSFSIGDSLVICRRDDDRVVDRLLAQKERRLHYVIDDDLWAAEEDETLPADYRRRLVAFRDNQHRKITDRANTIVVSSQSLADIYRAKGHKVARLDPHWSEPIADGSHFKTLGPGRPVELGYLGSASHAADRTFVFEVFERLQATSGDCRLTVVGSTEVPKHLRHSRDIRVLPPLPWPKYRRRLARLRFHILLYPTLPTRFNAARSLNKLIEHAVAGGLGVYSDTWSFAPLVRDNRAGLLAGSDPQDWADRISALDVEQMIGLQHHHRKIAEEINSERKQLDFWQNALQLDPARSISRS